MGLARLRERPTRLLICIHVHNNPMNYTDPSGHWLESAWDAISLGMGVNSFRNNVREGNVGAAVLDGVGIVVDAAALALPAIPGGVSAAIRGARGVDAAVDVVQAVSQTDEIVDVVRYADEAVDAAGGTARYGDEVVDLVTDCLTNSFAAGTVVMTDYGQVSIEEIEVGTMVLAYNEETGEIGYYPVTDLISHIDMEVIYLTIEGEVVVSTVDHPFYTGSGEWIDAGLLQPGAEIRTAEWDIGSVESVYTVTQPQQMYNFTVGHAHTYFIGYKQWLVHNSNCLPKGFSSIDEFKNFGSDLYSGLENAGYGDVTAIFQGSSVTGVSYHTGQPFDVGRVSDFDVALASPELLARATELGIDLRSAGSRTGPLKVRDLELLGLTELSAQLSRQAGRPVNFMIFDTVEAATSRAPSIFVP